MIDGNDINKFIASCATNTLRWAQKNLLDIFFDNWGYIIDANLKEVFEKKTIEKMRPFITKEMNLLKTVVRSISVVYKNPANRKAIISGEGVDQQVDEVYQEATQEARIDSRLKLNNQMVNLLNHTLVRPMMIDGKLQYDILTFDNASVLIDKDNWNRLLGVQYLTGLKIPDYDQIYTTKMTSMDRFGQLKFEEYSARIVFTIEEPEGGGEPICVYRKYPYVGTNSSGTPIEGKPEEMFDVYRDKNNKAALPFVLFASAEPLGGLLNFTKGYDIVDACINIAILMVQLNHLIKYQSFKQGYISAPIKEIPPEFVSDPMSWILLPQTGDGKTATAGVLDMQANFQALWDVIKEKIVMVLSQYGIPPNDFLMTGSPASGFAKLLENIKLVERREDDILRYRDYEEELYDKTVMVYNKDRSPDMPEMKKDAKFEIEFGKYDFPSNPQEEQLAEEYALTKGIISIIDVIKKRFPYLTDEEALARYEANIKLKEKNNPFALGNQPARGLEQGMEEGEEEPIEEEPEEGEAVTE